MRQFFWGIFLTIVVIVVVGYVVLRKGYVNFAADQPTSSLEKRIAMSASDASVGRRAPEVQSAEQPRGYAGGRRETLSRQLRRCHGSSSNPDAALGHNFNPPRRIHDRSRGHAGDENSTSSSTASAATGVPTSKTEIQRSAGVAAGDLY